jgi:hypothetical protein
MPMGLSRAAAYREAAAGPRLTEKFDTKRAIMGVWRSANVLIEPDDVTSLLVSASLKGTSSEHENPSHPPAVYT